MLMSKEGGVWYGAAFPPRTKPLSFSSLTGFHASSQLTKRIGLGI